VSVSARLIARLVLGAWIVAGLLLTLQPAQPAPGQVVEHNLIPLRTIAIYLGNPESGFWIRQAVGNLLFLLPLGLLGPIALPGLDRWWHVVLVAAALSLAIEVAQLWIPDRAFDVDDLLLNVAGAGLGYGIFLVLPHKPALRGRFPRPR